MKKNLLLGLILFALCPSLLAQAPANNWIDYSKTYYRFYTNETGLHRISYNALVGAGISNPVGSQLQVFGRGEEVPIHVSTNGSFGASDYIEFYGVPNDGYFDTQLYASPNDQSHAFASLFTDDAAYYVTVNPSGNNLRYNQQANNINGVPPAEVYYMHESTNVAFNVHHRGEPKTEVGGAKSWFADFELGEGYTSPLVSSAATQFLRVGTKNQYTQSNEQVTVEMSVVGLDGAVGAYFDQHCKIYVNSFDHSNPLSTPAYIDDRFTEYEIRDYNFTVPQSVLGAQATDITMEAIDGVDGSFPYASKFAGTFATVTYPHTWNFEGKKNYRFHVNVDQGRYIEISNFNGGNAPVVIIDLTGDHRWTVSSSGGVYKVYIPYDPAHPGKREFYISSTDASELTQPNASDFKARNFTDYTNPANHGNYLMIYHDQLTTGATDWVEEYRRYRQIGEVTSTGKTSPVGSYDVVKVNIEELYDQFAHGIQKHPLSIKNFVNFVKSGPNSWPASPQHMLLLGKGIGYNDFRSNATYFDDCLVPTYGHQPSDVALSTPNVFDYRPQLGTGRIPARTPDHVRIYLNKLIEYEQVFLDAQFNCTIEARQKMKDVLFVTKGWGQGETDGFHAYTQGYKQKLQVNNTGWNAVNDITETSDHSPGSLDPAYAQAVNNGLAMIIYNGHSHGQYWEYNGHYDDGPTTLAPNNFNHPGCYPFILSNSCFVGQIHRPGSESQSEDYTLYENGGSIGFLATLALAYPSFLDIFSSQFVQNISADNYGQTVGLAIRETINEVYVPNNTGVKVTCLEFTFAGDPAMEIYNFNKPEYILDSVTHTGTSGGVATLQVSVYNMGRAVPGQQLPIQISSTSPSGTTINHPVQTVLAPAYQTNFFIDVAIGNESGSFDFDVSIDPNNVIDEDCDEFDNNFYSSSGNSQGECPGFAPLPFTASSLTGGSTYCVGDFVYYSITGSLNSQATYTWTFGAGASQANATGPGPHLISYSTGGNKLATLNVDYNDGCGSIASPAVNTQIDVGLNMPANISCNPQGGSTTITWSSVPGANSYEIFANGVSQGTTSTTSFQLSSAPNLTIGIVAMGANGNCSSPSATYTCSDCVPVDIQFQGIANNQAFCSSQTNVALSAFPSGGTFSGNGVGGNNFNPSSLNPGTYSISYSYTDNQGCPSSSSVNVSVVAAPAQVSGLSCTELIGDNISFTWSPVPGASAYQIVYNGQTQPNTTATSFTTTLQGDNTIEVSALNFDQSCAGVVAAYQCEACTTTDISFQGISNNQAFCNSSNPVTLSATPAGGSWSGEGITSGIFYPSALSVGTYTLTYTYIDAADCPSSESILVEVNTVSPPAILGDFNLCPDAGVQTYSTNSLNGTYNWSVSGNGTIVSGEGTNSISVDWGSSSAGTISLTTMDNGGCSSSSTQQVIADVSNAPQAAFSVNASSLCVGNNITFQNGTANGTSYQWTLFNPDTQTSDSFDDVSPSLVITEPGTYNITLNAFGCGADQSTQTFEITQASADIISDSGTNYCVGDEVNLYSVNSGGTFSWTGPNITSGTNGSAITVAPTGNAETYTLIYTDSNGCSDEQSFELSLLSSGVPNASFSTTSSTACVGDELEIVNNSANATSFDWSITNTTSGTTTTSAEFEPVVSLSEAGVYDIQLSINGCSGTDDELITSFVTVSQAPSLDLSASAMVVCPGDPITLSLISDGTSFEWTSTVVGALNETVGGSVTATVNGPTTFYVTALNAAGCPSTSSIEITTDNELCLNVDPTCNDGLQNGQETGIDCGGPDCPACPSCDDNIQNGQETGVDCGGPDCPACPSCADGIQNGLETGIDCGGPTCPPCTTDASCDDGVQNGDETGVDCGGPDCPPCDMEPNCSDGAQNGQETGIDCGGPDCPPCSTGECDINISIDILCDSVEETFTIMLSATGGLPAADENSTYTLTGTGLSSAVQMAVGEVIEVSFDNETDVTFQVNDDVGCSEIYSNADILCPTCNDGLQNGNEEGVDCGGPECSPCEDCFDGVQNGDEMGIDCGGSCTPCLRVIPNVITPNGDSFNDVWEVTFLLDYPENNVMIYSRWGSLIYERSGYFNEFDGTVDGEELPKGTYYYVIDTKGATEVINGTLTILR